jgi:hypothetical protein
MYNFDNVKIYISAEQILFKISDFDIFRFYCRNFKEIGRLFCSDLRNDKNPSCSIYQTKNGLRYKDFGNGEHYDCFNYLMNKFSCTYFEVLNIVANDFNLLNISHIRDDKPIISESIPIKVDDALKRIKTEIQVIGQPFTDVDYNYWSKYYIDLDLLMDYNVLSAKYVYIKKSNDKWLIEYTKSNPVYAYKFFNESSIHYKIYQPLTTLKKKKWLFNGKKEDIEGFDQLPYFGDLLIITKSMKDILVYKMLGYDAISLQGEANKLELDTFNKLSYRFKKILINYDNDQQGLKSALGIKNTLNLDNFIIPLDSGFKDVSDYIEKNGIKKTKKLVKKLINEKC